MLNEDLYKLVFSNAIRLCVDLLIPYRSGCHPVSQDVLVGRRAHAPFKGEYALPGGRMQFGETIEQAVRRIASEEVDVHPISFRPFTVIEFPEEIELFNRHSISIVMLCDIDFNFNLPKIKGDHFDDLQFSRYIRTGLILPKHLAVIKQYAQKESSFSQ